MSVSSEIFLFCFVVLVLVIVIFICIIVIWFFLKNYIPLLEYSIFRPPPPGVYNFLLKQFYDGCFKTFLDSCNIGFLLSIGLRDQEHFPSLSSSHTMLLYIYSISAGLLRKRMRCLLLLNREPGVACSHGFSKIIPFAGG